MTLKRHRINSASTPYDYNQKQHDVGSPLKTLRGSRIARSKLGVGKEIGGSIYVHKQYADKVVPEHVLKHAENILHEKYPDFQYNCIKYDTKSNSISFQEVPNFDTAREPEVGDYVIVKPDGTTKVGHSDYIFHHKWLWCLNDYTGFDVADSWNWSKQWLSVLEEPSDGNGIARWNRQLDMYGLPKEVNAAMRPTTRIVSENLVDIETPDDTARSTVFYEITLDQLLDYYESDSNFVVTAIINQYEFDAFDLSLMYGSAVIEDALYVCVTDGEDIVIDGYKADPEDALEEYDLDELEAFIEPATDEIIKRYASPYEFNLSKIDVDEIAAELLQSGYPLVDIIKNMQAIDLLENI